MKQYQNPIISMLYVECNDVISTSTSVKPGGSQNVDSDSGIDFGAW